MLEHLPCCAAFYSGENAGVGSGIDHPVGLRQEFHIASASHVAMQTMDAKFLEEGPIQLAPRTAQIIDPKNLNRPVRIPKPAGQ